MGASRTPTTLALCGYDTAVHSAAFSPDGRYLVHSEEVLVYLDAVD